MDLHPKEDPWLLYAYFKVNAEGLYNVFNGMKMDDYSLNSLNFIIGQGAPAGAMPKFLTDFYGETRMRR